MSDNRNFKLIKVTPNNLFLRIRPLGMNGVERDFFLTNRNPVQVLPMDWALGIFQDSGLFEMYQKGLFTFDDNDAAVQAAYEKGVYFADKLDFTPADPKLAEQVLNTLKSGNRAAILDAIKTHGKTFVQNVAVRNLSDLTQGVVSMLESTLKIQLVVDDLAGDIEN